MNVKRSLRSILPIQKTLSSIFDSEDNTNILTQRFIKKLDGRIKMNFKNVRINKHKISEEEIKMKELKGKHDTASKKEMASVVEAIAEAAENKYRKVAAELNQMKPDKGKIDSQKFLKIKKQLFPRSRDPPSAMLDKHGNLLTTNKSIENRALEVYAERLKPDKINDQFKEHEHTVNKLCEMRLKLSKSKSTEPWTLADLNQAVRDLKVNKSRVIVWPNDI